MPNKLVAILGHCGGPIIWEYNDLLATQGRPAYRFMFGKDMLPLLENYTAAVTLIRDTPEGEKQVEFLHRKQRYCTGEPLPTNVHFDEVHDVLMHHLTARYTARSRERCGWQGTQTTELRPHELHDIVRTMIIHYPHRHCNAELLVVQGFEMLKIIDKLPLAPMDRQQLRALVVVTWVNRAVGLCSRHATAQFIEHSGGLQPFELEYVQPHLVQLQLVTAVQEALGASLRLELWVGALNDTLASMGLEAPFRTGKLC